jgi:hypothetical protein
MLSTVRLMPALILIAIVPMMVIAVLWPFEWNFGPVMIMAGALCIAHFGWRYKNPEWIDDAFWRRHPRLRDWLRFYGFIPRFIERRSTSRRTERITAAAGVMWGVAGVLIGTAQIADAFPG